MTVVIDTRTGSSDKSRASRERFKRRMRGPIKEALNRKLGDSKGFKDIFDGGTDVSVPKRDLKQPRIGHKPDGGIKDYVLPGNKKFAPKDRVARPPDGGGGRGGADAAQDGDGEDDFTFHLSKEELIELLFDELELPHMNKKGGKDETNTKPQRSGFVSHGQPNRVDLVKSFSKRIGRNLAVTGALEREIIKFLEVEQALLLSYLSDDVDQLLPERDKQDAVTGAQYIESIKSQNALLKDLVGGDIDEAGEAQLAKLSEQLTELETRKTNIPFLTENDLRYRNFQQVPQPVTKAGMFCIMDVSGSMGEDDKANAKVFYWLLYTFLQTKYDHIETVFIRHTHDAAEVDHDAFFNDRTTGGTIVSPALDLMKDIILKRFANLSEWNLYGAQVSDGDNTNADNPVAANALRDLLSYVQAYFYVELRDHSQGLWRHYSEVHEEHPDQFWLEKVLERKDIVPVFRQFFKKRGLEQVKTGQKMAAFDMA